MSTDKGDPKPRPACSEKRAWARQNRRDRSACVIFSAVWLTRSELLGGVKSATLLREPSGQLLAGFPKEETAEGLSKSIHKYWPIATAAYREQMLISCAALVENRGDIVSLMHCIRLTT